MAFELIGSRHEDQNNEFRLVFATQRRDSADLFLLTIRLFHVFSLHCSPVFELDESLYDADGDGIIDVEDDHII